MLLLQTIPSSHQLTYGNCQIKQEVKSHLLGECQKSLERSTQRTLRGIYKRNVEQMCWKLTPRVRLILAHARWMLTLLSWIDTKRGYHSTNNQSWLYQPSKRVFRPKCQIGRSRLVPSRYHHLPKWYLAHHRLHHFSSFEPSHPSNSTSIRDGAEYIWVCTAYRSEKRHVCAYWNCWFNTKSGTIRYIFVSKPRHIHGFVCGLASVPDSVCGHQCGCQLTGVIFRFQ